MQSNMASTNDSTKLSADQNTGDNYNPKADADLQVELWRYRQSIGDIEVIDLSKEDDCETEDCATEDIRDTPGSSQAYPYVVVDVQISRKMQVGAKTAPVEVQESVASTRISTTMNTGAERSRDEKRAPSPSQSAGAPTSLCLM